MKIDDEVLKVLSVAEISFDGVKLGDQLARDLYLRTDKVLKAAGAKWDRRRAMHVFDSSAVMAPAKIEQAILTGQITTAQDIDFFETPDAIIDMMLERAELRPEHQVLEPSAGRGAIARRIQKAGVRRLVCIEKDSENWRHLRAWLGCDRGLMPPADFMDVTVPDIGSFDRIIMNPPFSKSQDQSHIRRAYDFLKHGGRLVSIASPGLMFRQDRKATAFREWLDGVDHDIHRLPEGSFKSSGTMVETIMVTIERSN